MAEPAEDDDAAVLIEIAAEVHRFVQSYPNNYASRALAGLINRQVDGEEIGDDERELVLLTLVREAKAHAKRQRFGPQ